MPDCNPLPTMPQFDEAMKRVDAWWHGEVIGRPPVRFTKHNVQYEQAAALDTARWPALKDRWIDAEYQVDACLKDIAATTHRAETFPIYWPNLGPEIYAAFYGCELEFGEITSWSIPCVSDIMDDRQLNALALDPRHPYLLKIEEMTRLALEKCAGKALVGVTCWCPGIDCVAAWRGPENLCLDLLMAPERVQRLLALSMEPFQALVDKYYAMLAGRGLPSVGWMGIPHYGKCHIAQTDFANMIASPQFEEFCLPSLRQEVAGMDRVVFHMDGKGVAKHLDYLLAEPKIQAIQWVQGVGADEPILQWVPLIKKIQAAGKSVVIDLKIAELEPFMEQLRPEGLFLCIAAEDEIQEDIMRRLEKWK